MGADSGDKEGDADEGDNDGDFPDKEPVVLSDSDVEAILDGIAEFRGSPVDWDYGEDGSDFFAAFIDELEREDRAEDIKFPRPLKVRRPPVTLSATLSSRGERAQLQES